MKKAIIFSGYFNPTQERAPQLAVPEALEGTFFPQARAPHLAVPEALEGTVGV